MSVANIVVGVRMPFELDSEVLRISFITLTQILWDIVNNPKYTHLNSYLPKRQICKWESGLYQLTLISFIYGNSIDVLNQFYTGKSHK